MFKLFKEIRRTGDATVGYPYEPIDLPYGYRGKPEHAESACIACGACAIACPPDAISMSLDDSGERIVWSINYGRCIFCGRCEEVCPTFAIKLSNEFELSVKDKADLDESCSYPVKKCARCGKPYASGKEIDYARSILAQAGEGEPAASDGLDKIDLCLECRRRDDGIAAKKHAPAMGGAR